MVDTHSKSFFGQHTGMIINSSSKEESFLFIRCLKKKADGIWEKPSQNEGKTIKISLEEIVMILEVLNRRQPNWNSYHTYKDEKTPISFGWEDDQANTLWINIGNYSKMLNFAQIEILKLLLTHILMEKIEFATSSSKSKFEKDSTRETLSTFKKGPLVDIDNKQVNSEKQILVNQPKGNTFTESLSQNNQSRNMTNVNGAIKGQTEKALLIAFDSGQEIWIPKSTIHSDFYPDMKVTQTFLIDRWILERNKILT